MAIYLPGISGPFVFDDLTNIVANEFLQVESLNMVDLYNAAYSLDSGPLKRPIATLTFALNYYFSGSLNDTTPYKLTNVAIHLLNGFFLFWLAKMIFRRLLEIGLPAASVATSIWTRPTLLAFSVTLLWLIHPIQLTSVLYVVQRMTSLATTFMLAGMILYLLGRLRIQSGDKHGPWLIGTGLLVFGGLGMLSKENAILLPVYVLVLDIILFPQKFPWNLWQHLTRKKRRIILISAAVTSIVALILLLDYANIGYRQRSFTLTERLLTQPRVLLFYISLILFPRIDRFGIYHDDISLSHSFIDPWTTIPAILGILSLILAGIFARKKYPLLSLGILWFFVGHLLESTIFALEIVHEHRNYLASFGVILVILFFIQQACQRLGSNHLWIVLPLLAIIFGGTTALRAWQWSDTGSLQKSLVKHHPKSARSQAGYATYLTSIGELSNALSSMRLAAKLDKSEPGYLINMHIIAAWQGKYLSEQENRETLRRLNREKITTLTSLTLEYAVNCVSTSCSLLQPSLKTWLNGIVNRLGKSSKEASFYNYLLGRFLYSQGKYIEAIAAHRRAYEGDPLYLHPLIRIADIYIDRGDINNATRAINELRQANKNNPHPRDRYIDRLEEKLRALSTGNKAVHSTQ